MRLCPSERGKLEGDGGGPQGLAGKLQKEVAGGWKLEEAREQDGDWQDRYDTIRRGRDQYL